MSTTGEHRNIFEINALLFRNLLNAVYVCETDPIFLMTPDALCTKSLDPSHIAMVELFMPKTIFEEYLCSESRRFRINLNNLLQSERGTPYSRAPNRNTLARFELGLAATYKFMLKENITRTWQIALGTDIDVQVPPDPKNRTTAKAIITADSLQEVLNSCNLIHPLHVQATSDALSFIQLRDTDQYAVNLNKGSDALLQLTIESNVQIVSARYSTEWLEQILKALKPLADIIQLRFATDRPIEISLRHANTKLRFWLAPYLLSEVERARPSVGVQPPPTSDTTQLPQER